MLPLLFLTATKSRGKTERKKRCENESQTAAQSAFNIQKWTKCVSWALRLILPRSCTDTISVLYVLSSCSPFSVSPRPAAHRRMTSLHSHLRSNLTDEEMLLCVSGYCCLYLFFFFFFSLHLFCFLWQKKLCIPGGQFIRYTLLVLGSERP